MSQTEGYLGTDNSPMGLSKDARNISYWGIGVE